MGSDSVTKFKVGQRVKFLKEMELHFYKGAIATILTAETVSFIKSAKYTISVDKPRKIKNSIVKDKILNHGHFIVWDEDLRTFCPLSRDEKKRS